MVIIDFIQLFLFCGVLTLLANWLGHYIAYIFDTDTVFPKWCRILERLIYRGCGINAVKEQNWRQYAKTLLLVSGTCTFALLFLLHFQHYLPLNPQQFAGLSWSVALNTAISYMSNTNWQNYSGETSLSYFSQMIGLTVQHFISAATGLAVAVALIRGLTRQTSSTIGNFYTDLVRGNLYLLLPLSMIMAIFLLSQGVPQNFHPYVTAHTLEGTKQLIAQGPVASQIAIKDLGTNGGGFFNANAAHPYENPTPLSNFIQIIALLLIPASLPFAYGRMAKDKRQGWTLYATMSVIFLLGLGLMIHSEQHGNTLLSAAGISEPGSIMEGKEVRFGVMGSVLWSAATTAASAGATNSSLDSFTPVSGMVAMGNIMLGEVVFGGVGSGFYGIIIYTIIAVFVAGLMVGRSPEFLGKKIEMAEIQYAMFTLLVLPVGALIFTAIALAIPDNNVLQNAGPHGLSEVLYAYISATGNNGSSFAGFHANSVYHNLMLSLAMLIGRFGIMIPVLALAGSLGRKKVTPSSLGTFPTYGLQFGILLGFIIIIIGGLTFFPVLALGPIAEHLMMQQGTLY